MCAGYPERLSSSEEAGPILAASASLAVPIDAGDDGSTGEKNDSDGDESGVQVQLQVGANSAVLYGPGGEYVGNYRKTNLYDTDMTWAKPGKSSFSFAPSSCPCFSHVLVSILSLCCFALLVVLLFLFFGVGFASWCCGIRQNVPSRHALNEDGRLIDGLSEVRGRGRTFAFKFVRRSDVIR